MSEEITYSNPRKKAVIENWPSGSRRVTATFTVEAVKGKGERVTRETTGAVKKLTYARCVRIVDGSDGRTYILEKSPFAEHISVMQSNMKFQHEVIYKDNPRFAATAALLEVEC